MNAEEFVQYYNKNRLWKYPQVGTEYIDWLVRTKRLHKAPYNQADYVKLCQIVSLDPQQEAWHEVLQREAKELERLAETRANCDNFIASVNELWSNDLWELLYRRGVISKRLAVLEESDLPKLDYLWGVKPPYKREHLLKTIAYLLMKEEKLPIFEHRHPPKPTMSKRIEKREQLIQFNERSDNSNLTYWDKWLKWNKEHSKDLQYDKKDAFERAVRRAYEG